MNNLSRRNWLHLLGLASIGISLPELVLGQNDKRTHQEKDVVRRLLYNENPFGPAQIAKDHILEALDRSNRYSTFYKYDYMALKNLIADQEGLKPENILLGHGSFELLAWLAVHFGANNGEIIVPTPTFDVVGMIGQKTGARITKVAVDDKMKMNLPAMKNKASTNTRLLTLCNPNNPTGTILDKDELKSFCQNISKNCPVLIDEAYIHFLEDWRNQSMVSLIAAGENVLITRTFSKIFGMAGLRLGFLMGPQKIIQELESKFTLGFPGNMPNSLSVAAAIGALKDPSFLQKSRKRNAEGRSKLYKELRKLKIDYIKSHANFVYFNVDDFKAFKNYMWENKILLAGGWPGKSNWARVSIGTKEDMTYFTSLLQNKPWLK